MATTRPKITFVSYEEDHDVLKRLAATQSTSVSKIVSELIHEVIPQLKNVLAAIEHANAVAEKLSPQAKERLRAKMEGKEAEAIQAMKEMQKEANDGLQMGLDMISEEFRKELESGNEKA